MDISISGHENNRPVLTKYQVEGESLAEAVADSKVGQFNVTAELDTKKQYALVDGMGEFCGLIMFWGDPRKAMITTFLKTEWEPGAKFKIHNITELDKQLNY